MTLKKIYGLIFESTKLVNAVCGPLNTFVVIGVVFGSLKDAYKIFLFFKNEISSDDVLGKFRHFQILKQNLQNIQFPEPIHTIIMGTNFLLLISFFSSTVYATVK